MKRSKLWSYRLVIACLLILTSGAFSAAWDSLHVLAGPSQSASGIWIPKGTHAPRGLVVWLHGGMQSGKCEKGYEAGLALLPYLEGMNMIVASPSACKDRHWMSRSGFEALEALMDTVFARYSIDSTRVWLVGVSDGGYGVMNYSLHGRRPISKRVFVSTFPGSWVPLENVPGLRSRLSHGRWIFLQGGADQIFPAFQSKPWMEGFCAQVPQCELHWEQQGEHDMAWWNAKRPDLLRQVFRAK